MSTNTSQRSETPTHPAKTDLSVVFCSCGARRITDGERLRCTRGCEDARRMTPEVRRTLTVVTEQESGGPRIVTEVDSEESTHIGFTTEEYCSTCEMTTEVSVSIQQTRAADEAPTRLCECLNCSARWREEG